MQLSYLILIILARFLFPINSDDKYTENFLINLGYVTS